MKKKLIAAGAASLAVAAMPVVGVFAVNPVSVQDSLQINVNETCSFSAGGTGLSLSDTVNPGAETTWASGEGTPVASKHDFTVNCNSKNYTVTAVATDLTKTGASAHGTIAYTANDTYPTTSTVGDDGKWTAVLTNGDNNAAISKSSSTIKSGNATTTDSFSVAYKAIVGNANEQGTYNGTVTYTLTGSNS